MFATIKSGVATLFAAATPSPSRNATAPAQSSAVPLTPESARAEISASVPPRSAGVPPKPAAAVDFISQAEVTRRVEIAFQRAIEIPDAAFLGGVALFMQAKRVLTPTAATVTFENEQELGRARGWIMDVYGDLVHSTRLRIVAPRGMAAQELAGATKRFLDASGMGHELLDAPVAAAGSSACGALIVSGRGVATVLKALDDRVRLLASQYAIAQGLESHRPTPAVVRAYLAWLLCTLPAPTREAGSTRRTEADAHAATGAASSSPPTVSALSPRLSAALAERMAQLASSIEVGGFTRRSAETYQEGLRAAARRGDPLEVAAAACALWLHGHDVHPNAGRALSKITVAVAHEPKSPPRGGAAVTAVTRAAGPGEPEWITTEELATLCRYNVRTIREQFKKKVLVKDFHYRTRPGGRKTLYHRRRCLEALGLMDAEQPSPEQQS